MGCSHMAVFIAGQKSRGLLRSQARMTQVCKRSQEVQLQDELSFLTPSHRFAAQKRFPSLGIIRGPKASIHQRSRTNPQTDPPGLLLIQITFQQSSSLTGKKDEVCYREDRSHPTPAWGQASSPIAGANQAGTPRMQTASPCGRPREAEGWPQIISAKEKSPGNASDKPAVELNATRWQASLF